MVADSRVRAYTRAVVEPSAPATTAAAVTRPARANRRRSATGPTQEQRKAWGAEWGGIVADYWKTLKARRG